VTEEYGVPDAGKRGEDNAGIKKTSSSVHHQSRIKEDDAHRQLNQAPFVAERYCKPVTKGGKDGK